MPHHEVYISHVPKTQTHFWDVEECRMLQLQALCLKHVYARSNFPTHVQACEVDRMPKVEVDSILDSRFRCPKFYCVVDSVGYNASEFFWEPDVNLTNASLAFTTFHELSPMKPRPHNRI